MTSYYRRTGPSRFSPTEHVGGAWRDDEQHMGPVSGLVVHAIERFMADSSPYADLQIARITFEILGMIPFADCELAVEAVRPGRTISLVECVLSVRERPVIRARAWLLARNDSTAVAGGEPVSMPGPETCAAWPDTSVWTGGYISSVEIRPLPGHRPGHTRAWLRTEVDLVADEPASDLARYCGLVDTANGVAVRESPREWQFPNVDLSVHLYRQPRGRWLGLDTTVIFGQDGVGLTTTTLHDESGPVGRAEQILIVRAQRGLVSPPG